jgi:hypothetical protein
MTPQELEYLRRSPGPDTPMIGIMPGHDRTLLYGYDTDRRTWHVYQQHGWLRHVIYIGSNREFEFVDGAEKLNARSLVPNKRLYPEACDFAFCCELKRLGIHLTFTTFNQLNPRDPGTTFFGRII